MKAIVVILGVPLSSVSPLSCRWTKVRSNLNSSRVNSLLHSPRYMVGKRDCMTRTVKSDKVGAVSSRNRGNNLLETIFHVCKAS